MGKKKGKKGRRTSVARACFGSGEDGIHLQNRLEAGIQGFFYSIDEDSNGFLEKHEFAIAQGVIAELAGSHFNDETATRHFEDYEAFDRNCDKRVDMQEFTTRVLDLCEVLPICREEILEELRKRTFTVVAHMRRKVGMELRSMFTAADLDNSGFLDREQLSKLAALCRDLASEALGSAKAAEAFLKFEEFDIDGDGKIDIDDFIEHFLDMMKYYKVPKRQIVDRIHQVREAAEIASKTANAGDIAKV